MTEDRDLLFDEVLNNNDEILDGLDKKQMFDLIQRLEKRIYKAEAFIKGNNYDEYNKLSEYEIDLLNILRGNDDI